MYEIIAKILSQKFNKLENPQIPKESKKQIIQVILWSTVAIVSFVTYAPRGVSTSEIIVAIVSFLLFIYFAIRCLKYFKIL